MNEQERIQWLKDRRSGVGGSDVAAILGLSKFKSPIDIYLSKIDDAEPDPGFPSEAAEWGAALEDAIAIAFQRKHEHWQVLKPEQPLYRHAEVPYLIASPDRFIFGPDGRRMAILEIKTASLRQLKDYQDGKIPDAYVLQIQHTMNVTGMDKAWLAVLVGGQHYFEFEIKKDTMLCAEIENRMGEFWKMVEDRTPPVLDGSEACTRALGKIYEHPKPELKKDQKIVELCREYKKADAAVKEAEMVKTEIGNKIRQEIGNDSGVEWGDCRATWKEQIRTTIDTKKLRAKYPDVARAVETETTARVLRVDIREEE